MILKVNIHKIKCIEDLTIELPIEKGLYALTGQNGSGKSTIAACASSVFFNMPKQAYFGETGQDAHINYELNDIQSKWIKDDKNNWLYVKPDNVKMNIKGFFEGSLIFGNRFKDMSFENIKKLSNIDQNEFIKADDFIKENLGLILQGDKNFYENVFYVKISSGWYKSKRSLFFYEKNGKMISQFHMSTGENLLISILYSLNIRNNDRSSLNTPCLLFLDEIELALHPSSLKRLINFLNEMANKYNYAIYFLTHSIELISNIKPANIFFIERHADNTMEVINPCYPAYATRILYDHSGFDKVILVEDELARSIIERLLKKEQLLNSKLVHVLPCGGYTNVIDLANDVVRFNILGRKASISIVLDGDVKEKAQNYINNHSINNNIPLNFLPIESLEKFLKGKLFSNVDHGLYRTLDNYIFQNRSLADLIGEYNTSDTNKDNDGKSLFNILDKELKERRVDRSELINIIVDYLFDNNDKSLHKLTEFLRKQMNN